MVNGKKCVVKLTHRFFDHVVVVGNFVGVDGIDEWPSALVSLKFKMLKKHVTLTKSINSHLNLPHKLFQVLKVVLRKRFCVGEGCRVVLLTVRTNVLIDEVGFTLKDSNALAVEPILAFVAADVEPEELSH